MGDIWITGYSDHRIRDEEDFKTHLTYMANNPVKARLIERAEQYPFGSAGGCFELDAFPRGLKPNNSLSSSIGAAKAAPFQSSGESFPGKDDRIAGVKTAKGV